MEVLFIILAVVFILAAAFAWTKFAETSERLRVLEREQRDRSEFEAAFKEKFAEAARKWTNEQDDIVSRNETTDEPSAGSPKDTE